jgi:hypothetical protein
VLSPGETEFRPESKHAALAARQSLASISQTAPSATCFDFAQHEAGGWVGMKRQNHHTSFGNAIVANPIVGGPVILL